MGFSHSSVGKESTCNAGDPGSIPGSGRSTGEGIGYPLPYSWVSLVTQMVKNAGDLGLIPGLGRPLGKGNGNPFQFSGLENSMDRGARQTLVHGVTKSWTRLTDFLFTSDIQKLFLRQKYSQLIVASCTISFIPI